MAIHSQRYPKAMMRNLSRAYRERSEWEYLCIHTAAYSKIPSVITIPLLCGHAKGKLRCPPEIDIVLIHNFKKKTVMEKSLHYVGIRDFVVLKVDRGIRWHNIQKIRELKAFLDSDRCKAEYIFYCDSSDAFLRDDPQKAIQYLQDEDCDLLFSSTRARAGYELMPEAKAWSDSIARQGGYGERYLNAGVFVAKTSFLREVIDAAMEYITENPISRFEYRRRIESEDDSLDLRSFPEGISCDQIVFRYLHQQFYPRMKIDYKNNLAYRPRL